MRYAIATFVIAAAGCSPSIHDAAMRADLKSVNKLLDRHPALIEAIGERGKVPLHHAVTSGSDEMVQMLLKRGADPNATDDTRMTPLHVSAWWADTARTKLLIDAGADVTATDAFGNTPLHEAAIQGRGANAKLLLDLGGDPTLKNREGKTSLDLAEQAGFDRIAALIRSRMPTD
jgi:ankyrin repeat protein